MRNSFARQLLRVLLTVHDKRVAPA